MKKVAIIGAGVSGLSVAHFLKDRYLVKVFEKEGYPGGLIHCERINGHLFHTCGGHVFNSKRKDVLDWFWSLFQRDDNFLKSVRNSVVFMDNGQEIPYPIENHMYLFDSDTQRKFINDLVEIVKVGGTDFSNFEEFLQARFGPTLYDIYFRPYNEKVWRRNLKNVSLAWLEGKLPMPTVEEMIFNNINHVKENNFVHSSFWYEKTNGSQFIADSLANGIDISYNSFIKKLRYSDKKWYIHDEQFDLVVFCGNIKDIFSMIEGIEIDNYQQQINDFEFHGTTAVFCEIDKNPYSWIYMPSHNHESHRIICTGNFATSNNNEYLSADRVTATIEFTDFISNEDILDNLTRIPLHPKYITHKYNKYTYPIQDANTRKLIRKLKVELGMYNFYFTGRFADWEYYNMDAAMGAAMDLCNEL